MPLFINFFYSEPKKYGILGLIEIPLHHNDYTKWDINFGLITNAYNVKISWVEKLCWVKKWKKVKVIFLSYLKVFFLSFRKFSFVSQWKKTFNIFHLLFDERKKTFSFVLNLEKSFLSLLSFCREKKIFLSFLFTKMKVFFLSRVKVFFRAHPWFSRYDSASSKELLKVLQARGEPKEKWWCQFLEKNNSWAWVA